MPYKSCIEVYELFPFWKQLEIKNPQMSRGDTMLLEMYRIVVLQR